MKRRKVYFYSIFGLSFIYDASANELIVETFENLDFGFNSHSIHQLIAASIVIAVITAIMVFSIALFRCYMFYCRNYRNTRQFTLPVPPEHETIAAKRSLIMPSSSTRASGSSRPTSFYGATNIDDDFLEIHSGQLTPTQLTIVNQQTNRRNTFMGIFDDDERTDSLLDV